MGPQGLHKLTANPPHRIKGRIGILKNHPDPFSPNPAHLSPGELQEVLLPQQDFAAGYSSARGQQAQNGQGSHAFAATALSYHS